MWFLKVNTFNKSKTVPITHRKPLRPEVSARTGPSLVQLYPICSRKKREGKGVMSKSGGGGGGAVVASTDSLSFDEVSQYFCMPLADAANTLGVCSSVLKKICRENGLVRWPYRKFQAGKTVEEIKKDAAREKKKELAELAKLSRLKNDPASVFASSYLGDQLQKASNSVNTQHQQGNRQFQNGIPAGPGNLPAYSDEFKQGFPSKGLSVATVRWWGSESPDGTKDDMPRDELVTDAIEVDKQQSQDKPDIESDPGAGPQGSALLLSLRQRAVAEGKDGLHLGIHRSDEMFKLRRSEKMLLLKIFRSNLPTRWGFYSC